MISNDRSSPEGHSHEGAGSKPGLHEDTLKTEKIQIERKSFVFSLKENPRGRFLRLAAATPAADDSRSVAPSRARAAPQSAATGPK